MRQAFTKNLLKWYAKHGRHYLPWRHTKDPYGVLVSEIMLQQTQVDRVIPKYRAFLKKFPTLQKLARASAASVLRAWQGMGYNRRALYLKRLAEICVREHGGRIPNTYDALRALPGIGDYTVRAVLCFAFGQDGAFHDTNIRRIFARVHFGKNPSAVEEGRIMKVIENTLPKKIFPERSETKSKGVQIGSPSTGFRTAIFKYHSALMDFGSLVCRTKPLCSICPMQNFCKTAPKVLQEGDAALEGRVVRNPQSKFEGSDRKIRGRIVEVLRERRQITFDGLLKYLPASLLTKEGMNPPLAKGRRGGINASARLHRVLQSLLRDGLITKKGSKYELPK